MLKILFLFSSETWNFEVPTMSKDQCCNRLILRMVNALWKNPNHYFLAQGTEPIISYQRAQETLIRALTEGLVAQTVSTVQIRTVSFRRALNWCLLFTLLVIFRTVLGKQWGLSYQQRSWKNNLVNITGKQI